MTASTENDKNASSTPVLDRRYPRYLLSVFACVLCCRLLMAICLDAVLMEERAIHMQLMQQRLKNENYDFIFATTRG